MHSSKMKKHITYKTQIMLLKEQGLYGSAKDPFWDRKLKRHTCCNSPRAYYHHKGCPACTAI